MEVSMEKSKIMTNSTNNTCATISMNSQKLEEVINFKYLGTTLCSRSPQQDCLSNGSNVKTKQGLAVRYYQLRKQVQAQQVSCHNDPPLWL